MEVIPDMNRSGRYRCLTGVLWFAFAAGCGAPAPNPTYEPVRVGTTGDVPPFSEFVNGTYVGIDIDLARDLGRALGRPVSFVRTGWRTLLADLVEGRFDLGMSGINVTTEREAAGWFSNPYLQAGKQAVVRCPEVARFARPADANRLGVQVLTIVGSTNDVFVRTHLPEATVQRVPTAESLYTRLAAGDGDLIFVEAIEAQARVARVDGLCIGMGGALFEPYPVAILMPRGSPLRTEVNQWLARRRRDGSVSRIVEIHTTTGTVP